MILQFDVAMLGYTVHCYLPGNWGEWCNRARCISKHRLFKGYQPLSSRQKVVSNNPPKVGKHSRGPNQRFGGRSSTVMPAGSFTGWGTKLPGDTCVQVGMHSTGRGGCACSTLIFIPCRTSLRNCCLVRHLAGYTLSIYWFGMRYRTEPLRHGIARWIMIDSLPASLHSFYSACAVDGHQVVALG